jgi:flagellar motor switch protein FliG
LDFIKEANFLTINKGQYSYAFNSKNIIKGTPKEIYKILSKVAISFKLNKKLKKINETIEYYLYVTKGDVKEKIGAPELKLFKKMASDKLRHNIIDNIMKNPTQTLAEILVNLDSAQTILLLAKLPKQLRYDIVYRIGTMGKISSELLNYMEKVLESQPESVLGQDLSLTDEKNAVAEILNLADRATERKILDNLVQKDPELATEVKNLMFVFDDILLLDDKSMQRVLKKVDVKDLSMALKGTGNEIRTKVFHNVSERVAQLIQEEMDFMGPVRLRDVEEVQQRIVDVVSSLEEEGEIVISDKGVEKDIQQQIVDIVRSLEEDDL